MNRPKIPVDLVEYFRMKNDYEKQKKELEVFVEQVKNQEWTKQIKKELKEKNSTLEKLANEKKKKSSRFISPYLEANPGATIEELTDFVKKEYEEQKAARERNV